MWHSDQYLYLSPTFAFTHTFNSFPYQSLLHFKWELNGIIKVLILSDSLPSHHNAIVWSGTQQPPAIDYSQVNRSHWIYKLRDTINRDDDGV